MKLNLSLHFNVVDVCFYGPFSSQHFFHRCFFNKPKRYFRSLASPTSFPISIGPTRRHSRFPSDISSRCTLALPGGLKVRRRSIGELFPSNINSIVGHILYQRSTPVALNMIFSVSEGVTIGKFVPLHKQTWTNKKNKLYEEK